MDTTSSYSDNMNRSLEDTKDKPSNNCCGKNTLASSNFQICGDIMSCKYILPRLHDWNSKAPFPFTLSWDHMVIFEADRSPTPICHKRKEKSSLFSIWFLQINLYDTIMHIILSHDNINHWPILKSNYWMDYILAFFAEFALPIYLFTSRVCELRHFFFSSSRFKPVH